LYSIINDSNNLSLNRSGVPPVGQLSWLFFYKEQLNGNFKYEYLASETAPFLKKKKHELRMFTNMISLLNRQLPNACAVVSSWHSSG
jgi:hypothetical protein